MDAGKGEGFDLATQRKGRCSWQLFSAAEKPRAGLAHRATPFESLPLAK